MSVDAIAVRLKALSEKGLILERVGAKLKFDAPTGLLSPDDWAWLKRNKAETLERLEPKPKPSINFFTQEAIAKYRGLGVEFSLVNGDLESASILDSPMLSSPLPLVKVKPGFLQPNPYGSVDGSEQIIDLPVPCPIL